MHSHDPLHVPAACRQDDMDYQWFSIYGMRDPEATGWQEVPRSAMPEEYTESSTSIDRREMRLYWRPLATRGCGLPRRAWDGRHGGAG